MSVDSPKSQFTPTSTIHREVRALISFATAACSHLVHSLSIAFATACGPPPPPFASASDPPPPCELHNPFAACLHCPVHHLRTLHSCLRPPPPPCVSPADPFYCPTRHRRLHTPSGAAAASVPPPLCAAYIAPRRLLQTPSAATYLPRLPPADPLYCSACRVTPSPPPASTAACLRRPLRVTYRPSATLHTA